MHKIWLPIACLLVISAAANAAELVARQGIKICEVTSASAVVWTRISSDDDKGMPAQVRVQYWPLATQSGAAPTRVTGWHATREDADHTVAVPLAGLLSDTKYQILVEFYAGGDDESKFIEGNFRTAAADGIADVTFTVVTGQRYDTRDHEQGQQIYESMLALQPSFFVHTGDVVYYDKPEPVAKNAELARLKWHRMYAQPRLVKFHSKVASYFIKDDHDIVKNDCWPQQNYGDLTWAQGVAIFAEQTAAPKVPYRTIRWSKDLQVWFPEGREFRSPNNRPDGPEKTILGKPQFAWLQCTLGMSDATFKVVVSPTPIVGPDRSGKNDNHANKGFKHEGDRLRKLLSETPNTYVACGDRHWQYVSVDPATGLREYSCGPTTNKHAGGWRDDKFDEQMHKFLRVKGGFLSVSVDRDDKGPKIAFRHHAVDGSVVHEEVLHEGAGGREQGTGNGELGLIGE